MREGQSVLAGLRRGMEGGRLPLPSLPYILHKVTELFSTAEPGTDLSEGSAAGNLT